MFKETGSNRSPVQLRWVQSDPVTVKKSKFKGYCVPVRSKQEVSQRLEELVDDVDKGLRKASHPAMCAWKIASNSDSLKQDARGKLVVADQGFEDNGEGGAGLRLQGLLDRTKLVNVLVVVARWYGGTPLGPQRFRLISDVGAQSLRAAGFKTNLASGDQYVDFASAISGDSPAGHGKSGNGNKSEKKSNKKR